MSKLEALHAEDGIALDTAALAVTLLVTVAADELLKGQLWLELAITSITASLTVEQSTVPDDLVLDELFQTQKLQSGLHFLSSTQVTVVDLLFFT